MSADKLLVVVEIPRRSEAFRVLRAALLSRDTTLVRFAVDGDALKLRSNCDGWSHPLAGATVRALHTTKSTADRMENEK